MGRPRKKQHFRVRVSISSHPNTAGMWGDPMDRGIYCELLRLAIVKYAADNDDEFLISAAEMMGVTGCDSHSAAGRRIKAWIGRLEVTTESLGGEMPVTLESIDSHWRVRLRNLRKVQEFDKLGGAGKAPPEDRGQKTEDRGQKTDTREGESDPPGPVIPKEKEKPKRKPKPVPVFALEAAKLLAMKLRERHSGARIPTTEKGFESWGREMARIEAEPASIGGAIEWLYGQDNEGDFRIEVQSGRALRDKWGRICAAAKRVERRGGNGSQENGQLDYIAKKAREQIALDRRRAGLEDPPGEHDRRQGSEDGAAFSPFGIPPQS